MCNISTVLWLGGDWALASNNISPGEADITSLRQSLRTHLPARSASLFCFVALFIGRVKTKKSLIITLSGQMMLKYSNRAETS